MLQDGRDAVPCLLACRFQRLSTNTHVTPPPGQPPQYNCSRVAVAALLHLNTDGARAVVLQ
jgi:hypothetical protein